MAGETEASVRPLPSFILRAPITLPSRPLCPPQHPPAGEMEASVRRLLVMLVKDVTLGYYLPSPCRLPQ